VSSGLITVGWQTRQAAIFAWLHAHPWAPRRCSGWCYDEVGCLERAATPLGSSSTWAAKAATMECSPSTSNYVQLWYCDGASFRFVKSTGHFDVGRGLRA